MIKEGKFWAYAGGGERDSWWGVKRGPIRGTSFRGRIIASSVVSFS